MFHRTIPDGGGLLVRLFILENESDFEEVDDDNAITIALDRSAQVYRMVRAARCAVAKKQTSYQTSRAVLFFAPLNAIGNC